MACRDAPTGLVRIAGHQSAGRGRLDRQWRDLPGAGLAVSVVWRADQPPQRWGWLSLLTGQAVAQGLRDIGRAAGLDEQQVRLKWPNDVLIGGQKVCGVLAQTDGDKAVLGWGLNVTAVPEDLPDATSLRDAGWPTDATAVTAAVLARLEVCLTNWSKGQDMRASYGALSATLGALVRVQGASMSDQQSAGTWEGRALGLSYSGALLVETLDGPTVSVEAGDVQQLRRLG